MELLGHRATLCLAFEKLSDYFTKQLHHFTIPPAAQKSSTCYTSLPAFDNGQSFGGYSHSSGWEVAAQWGFHLHFPND